MDICLGRSISGNCRRCRGAITLVPDVGSTKEGTVYERTLRSVPITVAGQRRGGRTNERLLWAGLRVRPLRKPATGRSCVGAGSMADIGMSRCARHPLEDETTCSTDILRTSEVGRKIRVHADKNLVVINKW